MSKIGLLTPLYAKASKVPQDMLVDLMSEFCRAGGSATMTEWLAMSTEEREALVEAKKLVFTEVLEGIAESMTPDAADAASSLAKGIARG